MLVPIYYLRKEYVIICASYDVCSTYLSLVAHVNRMGIRYFVLTKVKTMMGMMRDTNTNTSGIWNSDLA